MSVASAGMSDEQSTSQTLSGSVVPGDRSKPLRPAEMFQAGGHSEDRIAPSVERRDTIGQIRDAHRQRSWPGRRHHQTSLSATLALIQELPKMQAMDRNSRQIRGLTCEAGEAGAGVMRDILKGCYVRSTSGRQEGRQRCRQECGRHLFP
jgi:hypothetical protein